jgi:hypothetical protein
VLDSNPRDLNPAWFGGIAGAVGLEERSDLIGDAEQKGVPGVVGLGLV